MAVLGHAFSGEFSDTFHVAIVPVSEIAARAYDAAGRAHVARGDHAGAAACFTKASVAEQASRIHAHAP